MMGVEHLTYDAAYFTGGGYGGYSDAESAHDLALYEGHGVGVLASFAAKGFSLAGVDLLVLGCALGRTVAHYRAQGANCWGMDVSTWAVANEVTGGFVLQGDARSAADLDAAEAAAGVNRWDAIISEQLIPCFTDAEVNAAVPLWRDRSTRRPALDWSGVLHVVHTHETREWNEAVQDYDEPYVRRTLAEWRALLDAQLGGGDRPDYVWRFIDGAEG